MTSCVPCFIRPDVLSARTGSTSHASPGGLPVRVSSIPRTVFPGWTGDTARADEKMAAVTGDSGLWGHSQGREPVTHARPRLLFAGPVEGVPGVLIQHLTAQGEWEISLAPSLEEAESRIENLAPDVLVAAWTGLAEAKAQVSAIRERPSGAGLPVILIGAPPVGSVVRPYQPVRGVLCLPRSLSWRTLFLCLDEHLIAWRRRSKAG